MRLVNNYFKAVVTTHVGDYLRTERFEVFPFDDEDEDDTRRAWQNLVDYRLAFARSDLVLASAWRLVERYGPWHYGVAIIGNARGWLLDQRGHVAVA